SGTNLLFLHMTWFEFAAVVSLTVVPAVLPEPAHPAKGRAIINKATTNKRYIIILFLFIFNLH
ncbi:MAG: hypothetical protein ACXWE6_11480, partial [Nitrososphaeraceae archaeon]